MEVKLTEVQKNLKGISYPATKDELVATAERNGAGDDVVEVLREAARDRFDGPDDVMEALKGRLTGSD
ncbi:MAG: DUF2795 domain-containing protein [Actinomycetota bacterium]|nr:DUF2795 domain-containing protein [Actinomycetota bacterium]